MRNLAEGFMRSARRFLGYSSPATFLVSGGGEDQLKKVKQKIIKKVSEKVTKSSLPPEVKPNKKKLPTIKESLKRTFEEIETNASPNEDEDEDTSTVPPKKRPKQKQVKPNRKRKSDCMKTIFER